jgi:hypothetical protein
MSVRGAWATLELQRDVPGDDALSRRIRIFLPICLGRSASRMNQHLVIGWFGVEKRPPTMEAQSLGVGCFVIVVSLFRWRS